jgi:hypothetical protein
MNIFSFNLSLDLKPNRQTHTVIPAMVFSKNPLSFHSDLATELNFVHTDILERHLPMLADFVYSIIMTTESEEVATMHYNHIMTIHKLRQKKYKTTGEMKLLGMAKKDIASEVNYVKSFMRWKLVAADMHRLNPFYRNDRFRIPEHIDNYNNRQKDGEPEERTIKAFTQLLSPEGYEDINLCIENMMENCTMQEFDDLSKKTFYSNGVFKLPMFNLPGFLSFKANKFQLLRDEIKPELEKWWHALHLMLKEINVLKFAEENKSLMQEKIMTTLKPAADELNLKLQNSIYVQQVANDEFGEFGSTFSFAITSVNNLLHAYNDSKQINDAVMQAVENYFRQRNQLDSSYGFLLHEVPDSPLWKIYGRDDHPYLQAAWEESMKE